MIAMGAIASLFSTAMAGHNLETKPDIKRAFNREQKELIEAAAATCEDLIGGPVAVVVRAKYDDGFNKGDIVLQAHLDAKRCGIDLDSTAVPAAVIELVWETHEVDVVVSQDIAKEVSQKYWEERAEALAGHFKNGSYATGLIDLVMDVGEEVACHFPVPNHLSRRDVKRLFFF